LNDSIISEPNPLEKSKRILEYVQNNYSWNEKFSLFKDVSVKDLIKEKSGSASEINILLYNLLEDNGINVKPVLISTRDHGLPAKLFPVISEFNYILVIANIGGKEYFLDATDKHLSFGEIPYRCLNQYGRVMDFDKGSDWIDIKPDRTSSIQTRVELSLGEDNNILGKTTRKLSGYHGLPLKKKYYQNSSEYYEEFSQKFTDLEVSNHIVLTEEKNSFEFDEEFDIESHIDLSAEKIYLNPFIFKYFTKNPFKLKERTYPIDFGYKDTYLYSCSIDLNDQYEVLELPKEFNIVLPNDTGKAVFTVKEEGGKLIIFFRLNFNLEIYPSNYYGSLKKFMNVIVDCQNNSIIVLKKK